MTDPPPPLWEEYRQQIEADRARLLEGLDDLKSRRIVHRQSIDGGPFRDINDEIIAERQRTIQVYDDILKAIPKLAHK